MEVLLIGDLHLSGKNPPERIDDVTITQFEKVSEIVHIANEYDVPIICTGDIFHTPIVSNTILTKFGIIIKDLKREFYFVLGNHDLQYHDINRIDHTSMGVIWNNNGKIEHIDMFHRKYRGYKWAYIDYGSDINYGSTVIQYLLSHKAIVNDNLVNMNSWVAKDKDFCQPVSDFDEMFELIVCGHWHKPYTYLYKSTVVINPGPVVRRQIVEREIPRVILLDLNSLEFEEIPLASALPTDEVLRETPLNAELKPVLEGIIQFINNVKIKKQIKHELKLIDAIDSLINNGEIDIKVREKLKEIMSILSEKKGDNFADH